MTEVVARLEYVLVLALEKRSAVTFVEKARSLFTIKFPGPGNFKKKVIKNEEQPTAIGEGSSQQCEDTTSGKVVQHIVTPNLKIFTFAELKKATKNFRPDSILGEGGFGKVYKGWVDGVTYAPMETGVGIPVAIKTLSPDSMQGLEEWQAEVQFLGKYSHPNLVRLLGHCWEDRTLLLVYEFLQKGSLENHLFQRRNLQSLSWNRRIKIAIGAAQGLAFLHATEGKVIYRDFKASNILLDKELNAKLSDFGLAKSGPSNEMTHVTTRVMGTHGCAAPEYISTGHLYVKSDVYGFGVVLLEMITGLQVLDTNRPSPQQNLVEWAKPYMGYAKKVRKIMDPRMEQVYPIKGATKAAKLVLNCLHLDPKERPSMEEVVASLEKINEIEMRTKSETGLTRAKFW